MNDADQAVAAFVATKGEEWKNLVMVACATDAKYIDKAAAVLSTAAKVGKSTLKRKIVAIHYARSHGLGFEQIIDAGQKHILKTFVEEKVKARTAPLVVFPHKLTPEVAKAFDANCRRVGKLLQLRTWDEVVQWINAQIELASDEEIVHAGGEADVKKRNQARGPVHSAAEGATRRSESRQV